MIRKIVFWFTRRYRYTTASRWAVLAIDIFTLIVAFAITDMLRLRMISHIDWPSLIVKLAAFIVLASVCYVIVGTHRAIIRHSGMYDIYKIIIANVMAAAVLVVFNLVNNNHPIIQNRYTPAYSEILMTFALQIAAMLSVRLFLQRIYNDYIRRHRPTCNVVIYGAGAAGTIASNALHQDMTHEYRVVAYLDDNAQKHDTALNGVRVLAPQAVLNNNYIAKHKVEVLLIAIPSIKVARKQEIMNKGLDLGLTVKSVPHINNWINDSFTANQIHDIQIEDLLERESIKLDNVNIVRELVDKVVLVTGAAGSIGSEICRQLIQYQPSKIVMLDQAESPMYDLQFELRSNEPYKRYADHMEFVIANVKDRQRMAEVFRTYKPQVVYHAAAYKHVPFMEENPYEAIYVNVFGTKNVADLAIENGVQKFVMVSTDKAVNPTNVMGATKRMAEIYIQSRSTAQTHFVTTRFGNVLGSNGSVIPLFKKQLAAGGPLTVTHKDIIRYFMTIPEACNLVLEAGAMGQGGDIFVFDMGKPVKIYDLATKMIQLSGLKNIKIKEVGLRPGEKLYEELLATKENTMPTYHPKIMRAEVRKYSLEDIDKAYAELWELMPTLDPLQLVGKMKAIVPEFKSNNSIYCQLDK
ncbi:MAG: polysaccharide biosynthesis protein [Bacteroidales bacterium]|nr:polysaccharide biosynthesis protein [Bacteroidales bacterium]